MDDPTLVCLADYEDSNNTAEALACVAAAVQSQASQRQSDMAAGLDAFFLIFAAALMFVLQAGFAMVCAGCVRQKNVQNTMMKNILDCCGSALGFFVCGYALAYGGTDGVITTQDTLKTDSTFAGNDNFFLMNSPNYAFWFYQFAFAATTSTIVAGCLAERCQMMGYFYYSLIVSAIVFPLNAHAIWSGDGFLNAFKADRFLDVGVVDFAGAGVVHMAGGTVACVASIVLGPRRGRFYDAEGNVLEHPIRIQGYSVPLQTLGTFLLWFGWYGFNAGSAQFISTEGAGYIASVAVVNTTLGGAAGCIAALFTDAWKTYREIGEMQLNIGFGLNGALAGLVGITGCCAIIEPWAAVLTGAIAGLIYLYGSALLLRLRIDDAIDSIPVHMFGGAWGMLATALFASPGKFARVYGHDDHVGLFYALARGSSAKLLAANLVGLFYIAGFSAAIMTPFFLILNKLGWFRADAIEELVGLDFNFTGAADANAEEIKVDGVRGLKENRMSSNRDMGEEDL